MLGLKWSKLYRHVFGDEDLLLFTNFFCNHLLSVLCNEITDHDCTGQNIYFYCSLYKPRNGISYNIACTPNVDRAASASA